MIQHITFSNGGFVLHKVEIEGYKGCFSAWYNKNGELLEWERRICINRTYRHSHNNKWNVRESLETIGKRYKQDNAVISVSNFEQSFTITIKSMSHISTDTLKNLIQTKFEVTDIQLSNETINAR